MEWATLQHLDVRHVGRGGTAKQLQPHAAAFHPTQALLSVAIGAHIIEFDALTGSKLSDVDIGGPVVRMAYSPTKAHAVIAILEDCTIRSCDFDLEQTCVLHSPERKTDSINSDTEVFLALTPLQPVVFFGFYRRMSVTVVGTVEGGRAPTKIKTDLKKPVVNLACHPRLPVLYVAYADGLIRAYNINSYAVNYTLQLDTSTKLIGAGAFAFHPTLEWIFVGDRSGTLLSWDVSTERPNMIGIIQIGSQSIVSVAWLSMLRLLITLSKDGTLQVWKTRVVVNPNRPPMQANFFEPAGIEPINIPRILSQQGGEAVYPLPRIMAIEIHPKMNLSGLLFASSSGSDNSKNQSRYTRDGRKQLFSVLQSARGSSASVLKEKLATLGSTGVLADHQLKALMQEYYVKGLSNHNVADIARKAILYSHFMEGQAKSKPISRLPLITIQDTKHHLKDIPVCWPIHLDLNFYNKENRVLHYPSKAFYIDGVNLMAYSISSSTEIVYKKLYASVPGNVEFRPMHIVYSKKQQLFLVMYEFSGSNNEIVVCWENNNPHPIINKGNNFKGRDAAFIGLTENQFAVLDEDKIGLSLYMLPGGSSITIEKDMLGDQNMTAESVNNSVRGPMQFIFESEVDRIFSTPLDATLMYACNGEQISLAKLIHSQISNSDGHYIPTKSKGRKTIKLEMDEIALQVAWQEILRGYVAGIITTHRVMLVSADLDILASSSTKFDEGLPTFRSLLWVGPALLFSTCTSVSILGWDGVVRTILSINTPHSVLLGALNDRLLLANPTEINPRQKKGFEIKSCLVGLLEPLLIGFATMQQNFEQKIDLSEILYQITSRFDSLRVTPRSLEILARGAPVCGDLAVALSQAGPQFTQQLRGGYAIRALRFSTALSVLRDDFLRSRDYPKCPSTSLLFHRFRQLGYACIKYGQFDSAKETFEAISDYESLLDLFICHLNPSAMRRLAQRLEDDNSDPELKRYCERILRVRSSGWTQGIFANFAAESMVPKGPEWGGGNWDIKTPTKLKSIPNWELATEVLPYMTTDEGTIPTIVPDQIGVYLGTTKGRVNVVQVKDDSLVKAFIPSGNNKPSPALPLTNPPKEKTKLEFLMGMDGAAKTDAGSSIVDEQARAEEEFKKTMYGSTADGNSSDEEGVSKSKKIHIVINKKPVSSAVDVDKIKEATRNMKLDEALGPHMRTKSLTGSQDFNELTIQAPTAASFDLFGTSSLAQPAQPPIVSPSSNVGVSSGPIPEDFFQNTISSVQVAAALPPAGTYLSKLDEASRPPQINIAKPSSDPTAASQQAAQFEAVGLPDGGVPPQYTQSYGSRFEPVGLPDGGIPPQYTQPSASPAQAAPPMQQPQVTATTQPLDLSILGGSSPTDAGKPSEQDPLPPASVRPGQIPRGAPAAFCFKIGLLHLEQNQLFDALSCFDEAFLALAKDQSRGVDVKAQATIISQYKIAVTLLQEIARLQKVQGPSAISAKDEMARLSRHLSSLPLLAKHRINCIRTAIKRNMEVQNYAYSKQMLELLLSKAPPGKQEELRTLAEICVQRGAADKSIDPLEDPSHFCAATLSRVSTIGYDVCDLCGVKFSAMTTPGCIICGMGTLRRSDASASAAAISSPFA